MNPTIVLASASKRRSRILKECGIKHRIIVSSIKEIHLSSKRPSANALHNARLKAAAVAKKVRTGYIIGADTLVAFAKKILGKPRTTREAYTMLRSFSTKTLSVYTGVCVLDCRHQKKVTAVAHTKVRVKKLDQKMIANIVAGLDPCGRAGGFSIEGIGSYIFDSIDGSFYNVLGLPMVTLYTLFKKLGVDLLDYT